MVGKILGDKNNHKIGLIIDVKKIFSTNNIKEPKEIIIIKIERAMKKEILIEYDAKLITKVEDKYAWLDITKKEFDSNIKNATKIEKQEIIQKGRDLSVLKNYRPPPGRF